MGYSHLLSTEASLANFRAVYDIPWDVDIAYCHKGDIALQWRFGSNIVFFSLMTILKGRVRFPVDPLILNTLRFYGLCPDQLPPNFYQVVSCVTRLNQIYELQSNHHDINFMYSLCGNIRSDYYLNVRNVPVLLISCLLDSNRNSTGEYVWVSSNCLADKLTCPTLPLDIGWYRALLIVFNLVFYPCLFCSNRHQAVFILFWCRKQKV